MDLFEEVEKRVHLMDESWESVLPPRNPEELYKACRHYLRAGGKRLRPALVMLASELFLDESGQPPEGWEDPTTYAIAIEMIHNFTLIHDDIMDNDEMRRGVKTVHTVWGLEAAILAGDTLYSKSFETVCASGHAPWKIAECIGVLSETSSLICEGQWMDVSFEKNDKVTEEEYLEMVSKKTGVLFGAAAELGGIAAGADKEERQALYEFGRLCGIAFQIHDDYLDLQRNDKIGKDWGSDIREGKKTLIAIHALSQGIDIPGFGNPDATPEDLKAAVDVLTENGLMDYAREMEQWYVDEGKKKLERFDDCEAKDIMLALADYFIERNL